MMQRNGKIMKRFFAIVLILAMVSLLAACESGNVSAPTQEPPEVSTEESILDLSAFEGECPVTVNADIEKEADSWLLDVNIKATNNSDKHITQLMLYFVKCYDNNSAIESWEYCDRLTFQDISVGETKDSRWVLGTTDVGAREYLLYVAYVLYDDGSSWGEEKINHESVVTVGAKADIYLYGSGVVTATTDKQYIITYSAHIISNSSVGDSWSYGMKFGDIRFHSGEEITVGVGEMRGPILTICAKESDAEKDDYAQKDIHFAPLAVGQSETRTEQLIVTENEGRYIGHKACVEFTVTVTCTGE